MKQYNHNLFRIVSLLLFISLIGFTACDNSSTGSEEEPEILDPDTAPKASIDRFSDAAGTLFQRSANPDLPAANEPINFDQIPFITQGLGPNGEMSEYYNFDVMPLEPAPIYLFFHEGEDDPIADQLNIVGVIPGDSGYNDFWRVNRVIVPQDYIANTVTSLSELEQEGFMIEETTTIVNCPVVPDESIATKRYSADEETELHRGWYNDQVIYYFNFFEKILAPQPDGTIPTSPIFVSFNINPGQEGGGPPSGFRAEEGTDLTHNVPATLPEDADYSPLWFVNIYDNQDFDMVSDLPSAMNAMILAEGAAIVNCPVVSVTP